MGEGRRPEAGGRSLLRHHPQRVADDTPSPSLVPGVFCAQPGARAPPVKTKANLEKDDLGDVAHLDC